MHRLPATRFASHKDACALLLVSPIERHIVEDVVCDMPPIAERAVVDELVDEVLCIEMGLITHLTVLSGA